jgi:ribosomal protein L30E
MAEIDTLIKADKEKKMISGFKESLKALRSDKVDEIFITKTCPDTMKRQLKETADMAKAKFTELSVTAEQLSAQLKKPFTITVAAISK